MFQSHEWWWEKTYWQYKASKMPITHIGKTQVVPHHNSRQVELQNIYHVLGMKKNLLSISQLIDSGNYVLFGWNDVKIYRNLKVTSTTPMEGRRSESIYVIPIKTTFVVIDETPTWWYNEISLPDSRKLEQELQYKLEREDKEVRLNRNNRYVKNITHKQRRNFQKEKIRTHGKQ